jgi:pimeloyl-ACP methyl ester carboxylesterase
VSVSAIVGNAKFGDGTGHVFAVTAEGRDDAPLVLMLHGFGVSRVFWNAQVHEEPEADYFAVAPNRRGMLPVRVPIRPIMPVIASIG